MQKSRNCQSEKLTGKNREYARTTSAIWQVHNNKMERMNGELRQREKVMRTLERPDTSILTGMQLYHNYIRPHEALKGKTPSEAAGIKIEGNDKWMTLIQNASRKENYTSKVDS